MALQFELNVEYCGSLMTIRGDTFREVHMAAARVQDLNTQVDFLQGRDGIKYPVQLMFERGPEGYEYFGMKNGVGKVNYGERTQPGGTIAFYPKGEEGYWAPKDGRPDHPPAPSHQPGPPLGQPQGELLSHSKKQALQSAAGVSGYSERGFSNLLSSFGYASLLDVKVDHFPALLTACRSKDEATTYNGAR